MPESIPGPAYRIVTARLIIRCWQPADAPLIHAAINESAEHLKPWMSWAGDEPKAIDERLHLVRRFRGVFDLDQDYHYGIFSRDESQVLGGAGLHTSRGEGVREIGYWVHKDHINRGVATEASAALTRVAFEIDGVRRVEIRCVPANVRSAAVPRKLGFIYEGTLRQCGSQSEGRYADAMVWALLAEEYPASPSAAAQLEAYDAAGQRIL